MEVPDRLNTDETGTWKLLKSLYRLKQVSHVWNKLLNSTLKTLSFTQCGKDTCIYLYQLESVFIILAIHVDNMLIISNSKSKLAKMKLNLTKYFKVKDLGEVKFLLGIEVTCDRKSGSLDLLQWVYVDQLLKQFSLQGVKPASTPLSSGIHLMQDDCPTTKEEKRDMTNVPYVSLIRALMCAAIGTQPNITFTVGALSRFLSNPSRWHWNEAKHVLSYLKGTPEYVIHYSSEKSPTGEVIRYSHSVGMWLTNGLIKGFCNSDWARCKDTRQSTSGFIWIMGGGTICWRSKLQTIIVFLSMEAFFLFFLKSGFIVLTVRHVTLQLNAI